MWADVPIIRIIQHSTRSLYNNLGSKYLLPYYQEPTYSSLNLGYVAVPVMFQYKATPQFYLEAGQFGF